MASRYLSGCFNGELYNRLAISKKEIFDRLYIFDMAERGRLAVFRTAFARFPVYDYITDLMELDDIREMTEYFKTFPDKPLFVSTKEGLALALPWFFPSSSCAAIAFVNVGTERYYRALLTFGKELPTTHSVKQMHMRARSQNATVRAISERYNAELDSCFEDLNSCREIHGDVMPTLERIIYATSIYAGCGAGVVCKEHVQCVGNIDLELFQLFVLVFMSSACGLSRSREVTFELKNGSRGLLISAHYVKDKRPYVEHRELDAFSAICRRRNLRFEYMSDDVTTHVYFEPMRIDWAILGIKSPDNE